MEKETDYIYGIPKFSKKASLDNTKEMLKRLGAFCEASKIIHVAGTNGKGSVCAYLESIITEAGHSVGMFTSPHLVKLNERIRINGKDISDEEFEQIFDRVKMVSEEMMEDGYIHPSFFEFLFGMGMVAFSNAKPEYIILETGLGGRLDATNVIEHPVLSVITSIGLDHTDILGETLEEIAGEKAGIIKNRVPVVFFGQQDGSTAVIEARARQMMSKPHIIFEHELHNVTVTNKGIDFSINNSYYDNVCFTINSCAHYQIYNSSLAAVAAKLLGFDTAIVQRGIEKMEWIGRLQKLPEGLIIDGAHNDDGINEFLKSVEKIGNNPKRTLLFSAVKDKHYESMIKKLCASGLFEEFILCRLSDARGLDLGIMQKCFLDNNIYDARIETYEDVRSAYEKIMQERDHMIFSVGSLYLVGEILEISGGHDDRF